MTATTDLSVMISRVVRDSLERTGITRRQAADCLGIGVSSMGRRLRGETPFDTWEIHELGTLAASLRRVAETQP